MSKPNIDGQRILIKLGGSTLGEQDSTVQDIIKIHNMGAKPVVVHGGGKAISEWVIKQGIQPEFVRGLRRTNKATLDVAVAVLAGLVNSELVARFSQAGIKAIGLSGVSGSLIKAEPLDPELGYVGKIHSINPTILETLLDSGNLPVVAPTAFNTKFDCENSEKEYSQILNINADTSAGHIAQSLKANKLIFQTDVPGVLDARRRLIPHMTRRQAYDLIDSGIVIGGMIPKIEACADALEFVGSGHIIDGRTQGTLLASCLGEQTGTRII